MTDDWTLYDMAYLERRESGDSVEFQGATGDMLGAETSGTFAVFVNEGRVMLVDTDEVEP